MEKFRILVLTDHTNHSGLNSLYKLVQELNNHPKCAFIDVATRGTALNDPFFKKQLTDALYVSRVNQKFIFQSDGGSFKRALRRESIRDYDVVWLRLPPPIKLKFAQYLMTQFPQKLWINEPVGIVKTGSKKFLLNFPDLCPAMKVCATIDDIEAFKSNHPIVLKPLYEYGGKGIIRIDGNLVWEGNQETNWQALRQKLIKEPFEYLAVEYLTQVNQGDKRIIVVNGQVVGTSLRLPLEGSWICNASMGGRSELSEPDQTELAILKRIDQVLSKLGIVMYGIDTLMGNDGKRVLSEINTTSIGGLTPISDLTNQPVIKTTVGLLSNYIIKKCNSNVNTNH